MYLWAYGFDLEGAWHLRLYASDVIETGFKVNLEGWRGSQLNPQVQWMRSPLPKRGVHGHFQATHNQSWKVPVHSTNPLLEPPKISPLSTQIMIWHNVNFPALILF